MLSYTEENYLKAIFQLSEQNEKVGTNQLAVHLEIKPATANDMLRKLKVKELIDQERYGKIELTEKGKIRALLIVRKHRIWETFLVEKLGFKDEDVHVIAEQLEHIQSEELVEKLDAFLGFPEKDPHGKIIPKSF